MISAIKVVYIETFLISHTFENKEFSQTGHLGKLVLHTYKLATYEAVINIQAITEEAQLS